MAPVTEGTDEEPAPTDVGARQRRIGWALVVMQIALLVAFVVAPRRRGLLSPPDVLDVLGILLMIAGLGLALIPTPVPQRSAALRTGGIYALMRHPVYTGILVAALGYTLAVGSLWQVLLLIALVVFFVAKAFWEDRLLADKHGVAWYDYADHVGSFVPRIWGSR